MVPCGIGAQSLDLRHALVPFRDSLDEMSDVGDLRRVREQTLGAVQAKRGDPALLLRHGFATMRLADVTADPAFYADAGDAFYRVTELEPEWPISWYGLAFANLGEHETTSGLVVGLQQMLGFRPLVTPAGYLVRSAMVDSSFGDGLVDIAHLALRRRDEGPIELALTSLRLSAAHPVARLPAVALARARIEREFGSTDTALAVLAEAVRLNPDHVMLLREFAVTRFAVGRLEGVEPWYRGLTAANEAEFAVFQRDLERIVPDSVLASLRSVPREERPDVIRRFWREQDPDQLPTDRERLREHYIRLDYARHQYLKQAAMRNPAPTGLDPMDRGEFDDRGVIYLRHGRPDTRTALGSRDGAEGLSTTLGRNDRPDVETTLRIIGMPQNESWHYERQDGVPMTFHFVRGENEDDFRAVESALDIIRASRQYSLFRAQEEPGDRRDTLTLKTWGGELVSLVAQELLLSRQEGDPLYARMISEGKRGAAALQNVERQVGRQSLAIERSYELKYELPMEAHVDVLAAGSDASGAGVQIAFAIPGRHLSAVRVTRGLVYTVRMRATFVDSHGDATVVIDTLRSFVMTRRLEPAEYLLGRLPVNLAPGRYSVRVALESEGRGSVSVRQSVDVPPPGLGTLTLTDPALGRRSVPLVWSTEGADTVWANPLHTFPIGESMQLYFEVGGLAAGSEYAAELAVIAAPSARDIARLGREAACTGRQDLIRLRFDQRHGGAIDRVQREVSLERLRAGEYALVVTISTPSGGRVVRCREFTVMRR